MIFWIRLYDEEIFLCYEIFVKVLNFYFGYFVIIDIIEEMNSIVCLEIILLRNWLFKILVCIFCVD